MWWERDAIVERGMRWETNKSIIKWERESENVNKKILYVLELHYSTILNIFAIVPYDNSFSSIYWTNFYIVIKIFYLFLFNSTHELNSGSAHSSLDRRSTLFFFFFFFTTSLSNNCTPLICLVKLLLLLLLLLLLFWWKPIHKREGVIKWLLYKIK